jgi:dolichol kinase
MLAIALLETTTYIATIDSAIYAIFACTVAIELMGKAIAAYAVRTYKIKINYVRKLLLRPWRKLKIYIISLFLVAQGTDAIQVILMLFFMDQIKTILTEWNVIRRKVPFLAYAFVSWDRLEDRPYTLRYDMLEDLMRFAVYFPFIILFGKASVIIMIPNLINEFGDGLAEPVGIRFGRHKYRTKSLWYRGRFWHGDFQRSLEGSLVVFIVSVIVLCIYQAQFTSAQFIVSLCVLPILMTLAEAFSPHTNDGPMLAFVGCGVLWATLHFV